MEKIGSKFIEFFVSNDFIKNEDKEIYKYALNIILSSLIHIATVMILGLCFNLLIESLVYYFAFIIIRKFAGGYHAKTPTRCYIVSIITWVQAQHVFAEPGYNASSGVYTVINNSKASWRGKMNSWWWGGKNCSATGKITAI